MRHSGWALLVKLVIVVATLVLAWRLLQEIGWSELQQRVASAKLPLLLAASLLLVSRGVLLYLRWAQCLPLLGQAFSGSYVLVTHLAAILVNHLTPTARLLGGVMRARYFSRRYPVPFTDAYGTVLLDQTSHQIVQGLLTWLALAGLAWVANAKPIAIALLTGLPTLLFAMFVWRRSHRSLIGSLPAQWVRLAITRKTRGLGAVVTRTRRIADLFRRGFTDPRLQLRLAGLGVAILAVSAGAQWLVFRSLGYPVGFVPVIVGVTVGIAAGIVTGTPGGIATTEAAMIASFVALGVAEVEAAAATLLCRGLHYLVVLVLGLPALLYCESWSAKPPRSGGRTVATDDPDGESPVFESRPDSIE